MLVTGRLSKLAEGRRMKSPFPGMDPYIEACKLWGDFHRDLISDIKRSLARSAPERYLVRTEERSYLVLVEAEGKQDYSFLPDVSVTTSTRAKPGSPKGSGVAVAEPDEDVEPAVLRAFIEEEHRDAFVEIYEATPEQRLVTTVEVLSPSNKRPGHEGRELYLRKRQSLMLGGVNLVEIDLLRGGERMPMLDPWPNSPYTLMLARAKKPQACLVWQGHWRKPLPTIRVPLLKPDADLDLDLQPLIGAIYQRSRYHLSIDYTRPLAPPLGAEDAAWLEGRLRARKRRE
jgi:hypothetical protein